MAPTEFLIRRKSDCNCYCRLLLEETEVGEPWGQSEQECDTAHRQLPITRKQWL